MHVILPESVWYHYSGPIYKLIINSEKKLSQRILGSAQYGSTINEYIASLLWNVPKATLALSRCVVTDITIPFRERTPRLSWDSRELGRTRVWSCDCRMLRGSKDTPASEVPWDSHLPSTSVTHPVLGHLRNIGDSWRLVSWHEC